MIYRYCYLERQAIVHDVVERKMKGFILTVWGVNGKGFRQPFIEGDENVNWVQMVEDNDQVHRLTKKSGS